MYRQTIFIDDSIKEKYMFRNEIKFDRYEQNKNASEIAQIKAYIENLKILTRILLVKEV